MDICANMNTYLAVTINEVDSNIKTFKSKEGKKINLANHKVVK